MAHNVQKNEHNLDGKIIYLSPPKYISEKLTLMTVVLEIFEGNYSRPAPFIFKNGRMDSLKGLKEGDWVNIQFKVSGFRGKQEGEPRYYAENEGIVCIKG